MGVAPTVKLPFGATVVMSVGPKVPSALGPLLPPRKASWTSSFHIIAPLKYSLLPLSFVCLFVFLLLLGLFLCLSLSVCMCMCVLMHWAEWKQCTRKAA